jgi:gamma-glutamyltranspeptidase/glutathione hydrolase
LRRVADHGAAEVYTGEVARALVQDVQAKGGRLALDDLRNYRAQLLEPLAVDYRRARLFAVPGMTGGPTFAQALRTLAEWTLPDGAAPGPASYVAYARALDAAFRQRLAGMGDRDAPAAPSCTTHFSVVDRRGNLCAVTQTLLSIFGSRVVSPSTGVLMNNGIMWFDPVPGRPNSLGGGKRCLGNYCPVIGDTRDGRRFALGASGGRKILGTVLQLVSFLVDHGQSLEAAFHQARIDMSGGDAVIADSALPADVLDALAAAFTVRTARRTVFPYAFAVPAGVLREGERNAGCTEIMSPWGDAVAERAR